MVRYEGMAIQARSEREIACAVAASCHAEEVDEVRALVDADAAKGAFDRLAWRSPEFAAITAGRALRISLISEFGVRWIRDRPGRGRQAELEHPGEMSGGGGPAKIGRR